jgi:hypothetical protein
MDTADRRLRALDFLRAGSADRVPHLQGTLLDHLVATEEILRCWGASEDLCLTGLCHAAYGTDGFAPFLVSFEDRGALASVAGGRVEEAVYLYASCDRSGLYPRLAGDEPVVFRDRFLDCPLLPSEAQVRDFVDLTLANELEIATSMARGGRAGIPSWARDLTKQIETRASPGARRGARHLLGLSPRPTGKR